MNRVEHEYLIEEVNNIDMAKDLIDFLLSVHAFDAKLTPGEVEQIYREPFICLRSRDLKYWFSKDEEGKIIAALGVKESDHRTSGFVISFIAVDKRHRHEGIGKILLATALNFVKSMKGRFLMVDTSDKPEYKPMRNFMETNGFIHVGTFPDFYYEGESTMWYYYKIK
jgi:GNAT superfamily N-acetyltransferase